MNYYYAIRDVMNSSCSSQTVLPPSDVGACLAIITMIIIRPLSASASHTQPLAKAICKHFDCFLPFAIFHHDFNIKSVLGAGIGCGGGGGRNRIMSTLSVECCARCSRATEYRPSSVRAVLLPGRNRIGSMSGVDRWLTD